MLRLLMLENEEVIDQFKKSLSATVKSIGKSKDIEINFVEEKPSINENKINLATPNILALKNNLNYVRAEADTMALEIRLHDTQVHKKYVSDSDTANEIFNVVEQSRIEAKGSNIFKGIKLNILNKHKIDIDNFNQKKEDKDSLIKAFKYVSYSEFTNQNLGGKYSICKNIIKLFVHLQ